MTEKMQAAIAAIKGGAESVSLEWFSKGEIRQILAACEIPFTEAWLSSTDPQPEPAARGGFDYEGAILARQEMACDF